MNIKEQYKLLLNSINSIDMDNNEKIKLIEDFKESILHGKNSGKKIIKRINGVKVKIPKEHIGRYKEACRMLKKYKTDICSNKYEDSPLPNLEPIISKSAYLQKEYNKLKHDLSNRNLGSYEKSILIRKFVSDNTAAINFLKGRDLYTPSFNDDMSSKDVVSADDSEVIPISKVRKPKDRKRLKKVLKIFIASFISLFVISSCAKMHNQISNEQVTTSINNNVESTTHLSVKKVVKKQTKKVVKKPKHVKKHVKTKYFNKSFSINKGSSIYSNLNDVEYKMNKKNTYYDYNTKRIIVGYGLKYHSKRISIIKISSNNYKITDNNKKVYVTENEANMYLEQLLKRKAKISAVISHNERSSDKDGIEGFFNKADIKMKKLYRS